MHHSWWSYKQDGYTSKTRESQKVEGNRAIRFVCLGVASYLPVLYFPASACQSHPSCIGKDLGMSTIAYASLMVELQQDGYTSKTRESQKIEGNRAIRFVCLGVASYLPVLFFPASACQKCLL